MIEAILSINAPEWMESISKKHSAKVKILSCMPLAKGGARDLVELSAPADRIEDAIRELKDDPHFEKVDVARPGKERALATVTARMCGLCNTIASSNCFHLSTFNEDGNILWKIIASDIGPLNKLIERLRKQGYAVEVKKIKEIKRREDLTRRQEEIIRIALEKGYFDNPKRISIRELGELIGVSISTLSEILRSGQKKILASYFGEK